MNEVINELYRIGILPIIKTQNTADAVALAGAINQGVPCVVIANGTISEEAVEQISKAYPDMLVGVGEVFDVKQAASAIDAGAKFIVSCGICDEVVRYCMSRGVLIIPGVNNATEINSAITHGLDTVGFFPAEQSGGINMIKPLAKAYPQINFVPIGGVCKENLYSYLALPANVLVGIEIEANKTDIQSLEILQKDIKRTVDIMLDFSLRHIGINCTDNAVANDGAKTLADIFSFGIRECDVSYFVNESFELMKFIGRGTNGHIAVCTPNVERAVYHLEKRGVSFDYESAKYDDNGKMFFIYLKDEIAGFAFHLVRFVK